jgi:hypothetical protein
MKRHRYNINDERRQATRFLREPGSDHATLCRSNGERLSVEVYEESLGGLGIVLPASWNYQIGQLLEIIYEQTAMRGVVRHVEPQADGTSLVGLECYRST